MSSRTAWVTQDFVVKKREREGVHVKGLAQSSCPCENETSKPDRAEVWERMPEIPVAEAGRLLHV